MLPNNRAGIRRGNARRQSNTGDATSTRTNDTNSRDAAWSKTANGAQRGKETEYRRLVAASAGAALIRRDRGLAPKTGGPRHRQRLLGRPSWAKRCRYTGKCACTLRISPLPAQPLYFWER